MKKMSRKVYFELNTNYLCFFFFNFKKDQIPDALSNYPELRGFILSVLSNNFLTNILKSEKTERINSKKVAILRINKELE